jgi:hypothetical protein
MEFLTLHDLSRHLDKPEKNVRYRFNQLKFANMLVEGEDYIKDDFVDETHFTYKINPVTFLEKTKFAPVPIFDNPLDTKVDTKEPDFDTKRDNQPQDFGTKTDTNVGTNTLPPDMAADFIAVLKEQLRMKDEQMKMKDEQLERVQNQVNSLQEINNMAMSEVVQLNRTIRQLAAPKSDTNGYQEGHVVDTKVGTNGYQNGYQTDTNDDDPTENTVTPESVGEGGI